jgi:transcription antitermination factor NusG
MNENLSARHWFALYTKPRHEFKAREQLSALQVESYLPAITNRRKWADRIKTISEPLIRGYVFIFATEKERLKAVTAPSVVQTVCFNGQPAVIPDWQIESLKTMLGYSENVIISDRIPAGTLVKVTTWPMNGVVGVVEENRNNEKYISIAIAIINRTVSVKLSADAVTKLVEH